MDSCDTLRSAREIATCATTSPLPKTRRDRGCAAPLCRSAGAGADTNAMTAGTSPKRSAASTVTATVNVSTRASSGMSKRGGGPGDRVPDIMIRITVDNRGPETADLIVLPQLWFRNTWSWGYPVRKPELALEGEVAVAVVVPARARKRE